MKKLLLILLLSIVNIECSKNTIPLTLKIADSDPFKKTITTSQFFEINPKKDTVIMGKNGTRVVLPHGCFINANGSIVTSTIKIELAEMLTLDKMLFSNLTTTSNQKILETDGMLFWNATSNKEQLLINDEIPVYIEIPTVKRKSNMMVYEGIRDSLGNMNWIAPKEIDKSLIPIDINSLNFYPEGFELKVEEGLPFRNHTKATSKLIDSLYYSLSIEPSTINEFIDQSKYHESSYIKNDLSSTDIIQTNSLESLIKCGVNPSIIKTIKTEKFQNTIIATKEFENRLKFMFKICRSDIIDIYIKNLDKNLWELDSIAALSLGSDAYNKTFKEFYLHKRTQVKGYNNNASLLKKHYEQQLKKTLLAIKAAKEDAIIAFKEKNEIPKKVINNYKGLLQKREQYRMETYGFERTETGWVNIDRGTLEKDWNHQKLEVIVENGKDFDRIHTYIIYTSIKSLYRLNSIDNEIFYVGNKTQRTMPTPKSKEAIVIVIGYNNEVPYFSWVNFQTGTTSKINTSLKVSNHEKMKIVINKYDNYGDENSIKTDLKFMKVFAKEQQKIKQLNNEFTFMNSLWRKAYPCYNSIQFNDIYKIDEPICNPQPNISKIDSLL